MPPLDEEGRLAVSATYYLGRGLSQGEAAAELERRFPHIDRETVLNAVERGAIAMSAATGASIGEAGDTMAQAAGTPGRTEPLVVRANINVDVPGRQTVTLGHRMEDVDPSLTLGELAEMLTQIAEDIVGTSFGDEATVSWELVYIL